MASELGSPPEQLTFDEVVGRTAGTELLAAHWRSRARDLGIGELVLVGIFPRCEVSDDDYQQGQPSDQRGQGPVDVPAGPALVALRRLLHWSRPSWRRTTRSILLARRSLCVATSAAQPSSRTSLRNSESTASAVCSS